MDKKIKIYLALFVLIVAFILYTDANKAKPINWTPSYVADHKLPYGTYVLNKSLSDLFPKTKIERINQVPYAFLNDTTVYGTYFFVNDRINFDENEMNKLLDFVARGNDMFLSTKGANIDTLGLSTEIIYSNAIQENIKLSMTNPRFKDIQFLYDRVAAKIRFDEIDTLKTIVLGDIILESNSQNEIEKGPNFVQYNFGKGKLYLHTFPEAFTNYSILKEGNEEYVASVLSYLDDEKPILWDSYYKTGKSAITSPMYYVLNSKSLKWAYYTALIGILLFILFHGKRNQRYIPVIRPLKNQTIAFTRTIATLYYEKSEHKSIAEQRIVFFLEYIRSELLISTEIIDDAFFKKLSAKSRSGPEKVEILFQKIKIIQSQKAISKEQLIELNNMIEEFIDTYHAQ